MLCSAEEVVWDSPELRQVMFCCWKGRSQPLLLLSALIVHHKVVFFPLAELADGYCPSSACCESFPLAAFVINLSP